MVAVCQIDMGKIKLLFKQAGNKAKGLEICMVLRALKDRLASLKSVLQRREIIIEYVRHDVCGLSEENANIGKGLLNGNARVREYTFANTVST